jgi:hypothetical protein
MRGLGAMAMVCLATAMGCLYLGEINYAPEVTLTPLSDGPYYLGSAIRVRADTTDRNSSGNSVLEFTWTLTDDSGRTLGSSEVEDCDSYDREGCFVPLALDVVYRITVTAADARGAVGTAFRDFTVANQAPQADLAVTGPTTATGHHLIHREARFSGLASTDPDAADKCRLTYVYETVQRPLASVTGVFVEGPCLQTSPPTGCAADPRFTTWCITPDAPGTYTVRVTVTDPAGDSTSAEKEIEVDPDAAPCLAQLVPLPIQDPGRIFVSRSDLTRLFSVNVEDDLDTWPPTSTNATGFPTFTWSLQAASDPAPVKIPDYSSNQYELDLLAFSAGEAVQVRVDVADRVARPCNDSLDVCPPSADPLAGDCVQRVTWNLEVY